MKTAMENKQVPEFVSVAVMQCLAQENTLFQADYFIPFLQKGATVSLKEPPPQKTVVPCQHKNQSICGVFVTYAECTRKVHVATSSAWPLKSLTVHISVRNDFKKSPEQSAGFFEFAFLSGANCLTCFGKTFESESRTRTQKRLSVTHKRKYLHIVWN